MSIALAVLVGVIACAVVGYTCWRLPKPRYEGHHTEAALDDQWADDIAEPLPPLPVQDVTYNDPLQPHIDAAWAQAGTIQAAMYVPTGIFKHTGNEPMTKDAVDRLTEQFELLGRIDAKVAAGEPVANSDLRQVIVNSLNPPPFRRKDFPGPSDSPARDAGAERLGVRSTTGAEPSNVAMGNWTPRETTIDKSFAAAIRAHIDGDYTSQVCDRYFSQVNLREIFARQGLVYVAGAA